MAVASAHNTIFSAASSAFFNGSRPITYAAEGFRRRVQIPDILDVEVEGILGADGKSEIWLHNLKHLACRMMAVALGRRGDYRDHGRQWDHTGKNAHYGPFERAE